MGLWVPNGSGDFQWRVSNVDAQRPQAASGTALTSPATANTKGAYVQILSAIAFDAYGIYVQATDLFSGAGGTDSLMDVGVDPAGGTAYSIVIPDLLFSGASPYGVSCGVSYYFPLWIRAGSSIAIRTQSAKTSNTCGMTVRVFGKPRDPKLAKCGTYVTSFGVNAATSGGTSVTPGTTSDGSWTVIGSALAKPHWWWQMGMGSALVLTGSTTYAADLGVGVVGGPQLVIQDQVWTGASTGCTGSGQQGGHYTATADNVYIRSQCSIAPDAVTYAAYALGG